MNEPIAIIGLGCRFPGRANDPASFWQNLSTGKDAITPLPTDRWNAAPAYSPNRNRAGKFNMKQGGFVENIDQFDAEFFGIAPRAAAKMDPQCRLLLEVSWEALEDAGIVMKRLAGSNTGVFIGISSLDYYCMQMEPEARHLIDAYSITGSIMSAAANRISYIFDLNGPSIVFDTACSSSLVAVHQACQSIWQKECNLALAGGIQLQLKTENLIMYSKSTLMSPTGRCRTFDAGADGFVRSEGAGVAVLKPLASALADGDNIYAVIRGTAITQDGHTTSINEPSADAQAAAIRKALLQADILASQVQYIEAHGTGTAAGDPIEAKALGQVFTERGCIVGSVKTNIGHTEAAAGIAGLIKVALALKHQQIPPNLHFDTPNPAIPLTELKLRIPTTLERWSENTDNAPRLAGVNSFGIGGTNAHVIVAEAPSSDILPAEICSESDEKEYLLPLSAHSPAALNDLARAYQDFFKSAVNVPAVVYNAGVRRTHHSHRLGLVAQSKEAFVEKLQAFLDGETRHGLVSGQVPSTPVPLKPVFVFSGMGQQCPGMGRELLSREPVFRKTIQACDAVLQPYLGWSLQAAMNEADTTIDRTEIAQPLIFALQVGLAALWQAWGIMPRAVVGHSVGEIAAAHVSGALTLAEAARVVYHRSRLQARTAGQGTLLAVTMPVEEMKEWLAEYESWVSIAAINSPTSLTLAGQQEALQIVADSLTAQNIFNRFLRVDVPYHSPSMDPLVPELEAALELLSSESTAIPIFSTVTGQEIDGSDLDGRYWGRNMRAPVQFADAISHMAQAGYNGFLEISAHPVLSRSMIECLPPDPVVLSSLRRDRKERANLLSTLGQLYSLAYPLEWERLYPIREEVVPLPPYPWQRTRYWFEPEDRRNLRMENADHPLLGKRLNTARLVWEKEIDCDCLAYLKDHRISGTLIYPATAYTEMILAAGHALFGDINFVIENTSLENALILSEDKTPILQTSFDEDQHTFAIHSCHSDAYGRWIPHFKGKLSPHNLGVSPQVDLVEIRRRCQDAISRTAAYESLRVMGYDYGPSFQGIARGRRGEGEVLFEIHLPENLAQTKSDYHIHPALADAWLHGALSVFGGTSTWLPVGFEKVLIYGLPAEKNWLHARSISQSATHLELAAQVLDENGRVLIDLRGLHYQLINKKALNLQDHLYQYHWQIQECPGQTAELSGKRWMIFSDTAGAGNKLTQRLEQAGAELILVSAGDRYLPLGTAHLQIRPDDAHQYTQVLSAVGPCQKVIFLWNLDIGAIDGVLDPTDAHNCGDPSLIYLVQALAKISPPPQLVLVTRGLHAISESDHVEVFQAPSWGLGRVVANELPGLQIRSIDLSAAITDSEIEALFAEICLQSGEDEIALRDRQRYVHRLAAVSPADLPVRSLSPAFVPYLATAKAGISDGLVWRARPRRQPGPGEVALEIRASGLNFKDVVKTMGMISEASLAQTYAGHSLGLECAGVIISVGADVRRFKPGDEVIALASNTFGTHTVTRQNMIVPKPARFTFEQAATLPIVFATAYYALCVSARLQPGERVLIHAAAGGVGQAAVQIAKNIGAEIYATAGSPDKREFLRSLGFVHVFDSRSLAFADEIMAITQGAGVDVVLNTLPGHTIPASMALMRSLGRFVDLSNFYSDSQVSLRPFQKGLTLIGFDLDQLMLKEPGYFQILFLEAMQYVADHQLSALPYKAFSLPEASEAFRYMAQAKHIGKIIITGQGADQITPVPAPLERTAFHREASYLITGGLRGFGLASAKWLADHGAKYLVLVSRSGADSLESRQAVDKLKAAGVTVMAVSADVSQPEDVAKVLSRIQESLPPLKGIIHAATVYEDQTLLTLTPEAYRRVMAPKADGAWTLHQLTKDLDLDFFTLFSSVSAVIGNMGQGSYVGANLFLDALAHHRRCLGLPALSINWGAIGEVGYLGRNAATSQLFLEMGLTLIPPNPGLNFMGVLQQYSSPQIGVFAVDWTRLRSQLTALAAPRFCRVVEANQTHSGAVTNSLLQSLQHAAPSEQLDILMEKLAEHAAHVLGMSPERLNPTAPLISLGLDSLMAVELSVRFQQQTNTTISSLQILGGGSLKQIAELLLPQLLAMQPDQSLSSNVKPAPRSAHIPLSYLQEPMWRLHQLTQSSPFYNIPTKVHLKGPLDAALLEDGLQEIIQRHDSLRCRFSMVDGQPVQIVAAAGTLSLPLVPTSPDQAGTLAELEAREPIDLSQGLPIRAKLLQLGPVDHILLVTMHHIVSDGTSAMIFYQELLTLYQALACGKKAELPELTVQYPDFVFWQRQQLQGKRLAELAAYWQTQLQGGLPLMDLPLDYPRPAISGYKGRMEPFHCSPALSENLKMLALQENVTLFTLLLTTLAVHISGYTGRLDFSVGTFTGARPQPGLEHLIGCFINALPIRVKLSPDLTFRAMLTQVQQTVLAAQHHAELPFSEIFTVADGDVPPQVVLILHNQLDIAAGYEVEVLPGLVANIQEVGNGGAKRDWTFHMMDRPQGLQGVLEYDTDIFKAATIRGVVDEFVTRLSQVAAHPDQSVLDQQSCL